MKNKIISYITLSIISTHLSISAIDQLSNQLNQLTQQLQSLDEMLERIPAPPAPNIKPLMREEIKIDEINIETDQDTIALESFKEIIEENSNAGKATIIARVRYRDPQDPDKLGTSYYNAYNLLQYFYGDDLMNPRVYRKTDEPNIGRLEVRVGEFGINPAKDPNTGTEIGTQEIEFYIIQRVTDPAFTYLGDDHTLYDPLFQETPEAQNVQFIFEENKPSKD